MGKNLYDAATNDFLMCALFLSFWQRKEEKEEKQGRRIGKSAEAGKEKKYSCSCVLEWSEKTVCECSIACDSSI